MLVAKYYLERYKSKPDTTSLASSNELLTHRLLIQQHCIVNMFARPAQFVVFLFVALPLLAAASAIPAQTLELEARQDGQCSTGQLQCCQQVQSVSESIHFFRTAVLIAYDYP
jgi:hypothetical protein